MSASSSSSSTSTTGSPIIEAYPLSHMQQGMLFHSISASASDLYVEQLSCQLRGHLNLPAFRSAWEEMLRRHAVLRSAFAWRGLPEPLQVVGARVRPPLEDSDWRDLSGAAQEERLRLLRAAERAEGFDPARAPLMRIKLVRLSDDVHQLIWTWHHVILDAWSVPIIIEELFAAYDAHRQGLEPDLKPGRPYKDFIAWQRSQNLSQAEEFWRGVLDDFREPTPFGIEGLKEAVHVAEAGHDAQALNAAGAGHGLEFLEISADEVNAIKEAARRLRVTLNTLVQGAWALLLSRYSGREDVLFGTAVAGRPPELEGVETMVGLLINTIPVRVQASPRERLGRWLEGLQRRQAETRRYEHAPLLRLQGWSSVPRGTQLFESLLVFENFPLDMNRLKGGGIEIADVDFVERASFPLTVMMSVRDQSKLGADYDRARFDRNSIVRMLGHLRTLLADMTSDPERRLADLDFVTAFERRQLVEHFSRAPLADAPAFRTDEGLSVSRLFEAQVERSPGAPAATFTAPDGDASLTYRELNDHANALARRLRALGVAPEERVVICMEPSLIRLAAVLAVMKAGGAYVPLDTSSPLNLLRSMIADCGARVLMAETDLADSLRGCGASHIVTLEDARELTATSAPAESHVGAGSVNLENEAAPDNLAYLIYTSGSTGRPKGVAVTHRSLRHLVEAQLESFKIEPQSRVLQFASLSFDASVSEIFTALLCGAQLFSAPRRVLAPSRELLSLMESRGITTVTMPPSVLAALPASKLPSLCTLVSAGEACPPELVARWANGRRFLNAYGPTECTVCATVAEVTGTHHGKPPIGRAIGAARAYILDANLRPVPVGVSGELHIGGPGVARGYWNRPDLTASNFIPDPFANEAGARMYRTGDAARFLPDGEIEFLGRRDDQVKVRGFRIELTEVEAALRKDNSLRDAAVVAAGDSAQDKRLIAYVVPEDGGDDDAPGAEWWPSIAEFFVYDELAYYAMTSDERRNESYRAAIREKVRDRIVVEVGTGPEALLARFCAEAGARRVYAIEMLAESYAKARQRVAELGLEDRIEVIHGDATKVALPVRPDVCVSEIVGAIGGSEGAAVILNEVRRRLLGGTAEMIPSRSMTMYAPVQLPEALLDELGFHPLPARYVSKIFKEVGYPFDLRLCVKGLNRSHLLAEPRVFEDLDFRALVEVEASHRANHRIERDGRLDGFLVWLTLDTGAGERIDILENEHCWLPVFFPVLDAGMQVSAGDMIEARCGTVLCDDGCHPDYFIEGTLLRQRREPIPFRHYSPHHDRAYRASPFYRKFFPGDAVPLLERKSAFPPVRPLDVSALKRKLRERLPEYMMPSEFVQLDRLPLTPGGKLDRRALPPAGAARAMHGGAEATPPHSQAERVIAKIWQELLQPGDVGLQTNFFDQGGHSLLLLKVQDSIRAETGVELPVTDLFKYPTVETLARHLGQQQERARRGTVDDGADDRRLASVQREIMAAKVEAKTKAKAYAKQAKAKFKEQFKQKAKRALHRSDPEADTATDE